MKFYDMYIQVMCQEKPQSAFSKKWIDEMSKIRYGVEPDPIGFCFVGENGEISDCSHTEHSSGMTAIYQD